MDTAYKIAKEQGNASAMVASALGIAKVFHSDANGEEGASRLTSARTMHDFGRKLLQSVGMADPPVSSIEQAIEANDIFVTSLERIASSHRTIDAS